VIRHYEIGVAAALQDRPDLIDKLNAARQMLGNRAVDAEISGWSLSMEAAIQYALEEPRGTHP
jgi:hypothetical protein